LSYWRGEKGSCGPKPEWHRKPGPTIPFVPTEWQSQNPHALSKPRRARHSNRTRGVARHLLNERTRYVADIGFGEEAVLQTSEHGNIWATKPLFLAAFSGMQWGEGQQNQRDLSDLPQIRSPPPLPAFAFASRDLRKPRGGKRQYCEVVTPPISSSVSCASSHSQGDKGRSTSGKEDRSYLPVL
jgi:hypothetical protein